MCIRSHSSSHPLQCGHLQPSRLLPSPIQVVGKAEYRKTMWISQQLCMQLFGVTLPSCHSLCPGSTTGSRCTMQLSTSSILDGTWSRYKRCEPPIFSTAPILVNMTLFVLICLAICFSVGPILSSTLAYLDIRNYFRAKSQVSDYDYYWEKITGILVGTGSIGLSITGLVAIATAPHSTEIYSWLDAVIMCNLQLLTSNNVRYSDYLDCSSPTNKILSSPDCCRYSFLLPGLYGWYTWWQS